MQTSCQSIVKKKTSRRGAKTQSIGTRNESSLHKTLKYQYVGPKGQVEADTGDFVADGIKDDGEYIEVQTGSFKPLVKKIKALTAKKKVKIRIIHPIAVNKYIEVYKLRASASLREVLLYRRKSPKKGSLWSLFDALVYAPELALLPGVIIETVLADITEIRVNDGKGSWRRKGISIKDRVLSAYHQSVTFAKKADYIRHFIPFKKNEEFTVTSLASRANIPPYTARQALYTLNKMGVVKRIGKKGLAWVYTRTDNKSGKL